MSHLLSRTRTATQTENLRLLSHASILSPRNFFFHTTHRRIDRLVVVSSTFVF
jgi:hypothetical protein